MNNPENKLKTAARFYFDKGWNVIPITFKKAIFEKGEIKKQITFLPKYQNYHEEKITQELINEWWGSHNGIAIVTGKISGITLMDLDTKVLPEEKNLPKTLTIATNKGSHRIFKYTDKVITNANKFKKDNLIFNIDIRNDGGIAFAAPSQYELPDGKIAEYKITDNSPLADFPIEWLENIYKIYGMQPGEMEKKKPWKNALMQPIENHERNNTWASIIGGFLATQPQADWDSIAWNLAKSHNLTQAEPLEENELRTVFNSIA